MLKTRDTWFFSIIEAHKRIPPHIGFYRGILRYHLALEVPQDAEDCFIIVNGQRLHWKLGADLYFDDGFRHEVQNNTTQRRTVLFLDVERRLCGPLCCFNRLLLSKVSYSQDVLETIARANFMQALVLPPLSVREEVLLYCESHQRQAIELDVHDFILCSLLVDVCHTEDCLGPPIVSITLEEKSEVLHLDLHPTAAVYALYEGVPPGDFGFMDFHPNERVRK